MEANSIELGWLAGILDGEGTVTLNYERGGTGWVCIANKNTAILERCKHIAEKLGLPRPQYAWHNSTLIWSGYAGTQLLNKVLLHTCNTKLYARAVIYQKHYNLEHKGKKLRAFRLQLWEEWKELIRDEYAKGENRGPVPRWL